MAFNNDNEIEQIRLKTNIVDIISDYISLTPAGKNFFGVCPFHDDHSPSLSVSKEKGIYKCFSCGAAGNVFTFVQNFEHVSFLESVSIVANKIGYNFNYKSNSSKNAKYDELYKIMNISLQFFKNNLNTEYGTAAKEYLNKRGLADDDIETFDIGLSLDSKDSLYSLLNKKGYETKLLNDLGLVHVDGANVYDSFVNRIIFPIHDLDGNPVGYTGRIYKDSANAKYYNSKETPIFKKGKILFNYHRAKDEIKNQHEVIIVEGNMDAIRMYCNGFKNTIALMGTSLTKDHIDIIKKLRSKVILMFDNDSAGELATINNGLLLEKENIELYVVRIDDYKDPDDYIKNLGSDKMQNAINNKMSFIDYKLYYYKKNKNLNNTSDLVSFVKEIINSVKDIKDNITREITLKKLSEDYNISYDLLKEELKLNSTNVAKQDEKVIINKGKMDKYDKAMSLVTYYMINNAKYIKLFEDANIFVSNPKYRNIVNEILCFYEKCNNISEASFITYISDKTTNQDVLDIIGNINEEPSENSFKSYINIIETISLEEEIKQIKEEMKTTLDINKKTELANRLIELKKGSVKHERN